MHHDPVPLTQSSTTNSGHSSTEQIFHCYVDACTLYWSRRREHFDIFLDTPAYTNSTSNVQMRCPNPGHGCLYLANIDHPKNRWTWNCSVCEFHYTDAPGAWANPPTQL
jgi:hypothetical protein